MRTNASKQWDKKILIELEKTKSNYEFFLLGSILKIRFQEKKKARESR